MNKVHLPSLTLIILCWLPMGIVLADGAAGVALVGHRSAVNEIAFSADSRLLATASEDGTVRVWSLEEAREVRVFHQSHPVKKVQFVGKSRLLTVSITDTRFKQGGRNMGRATKCVLWDIATGDQLHSLDQFGGVVGAVGDCLVVPDGTCIALTVQCEGVSNSMRVVVLDPTSLETRFSFNYFDWLASINSTTPGTGIRSRAGFLDNGRYFVFAGSRGGRKYDSVIMIMDCHTGEVVKPVRVEGSVSHLCTGPDESLFAVTLKTSSRQGVRVRVWRGVTAEPWAQSKPFLPGYGFLRMQFVGPNQICMFGVQPGRRRVYVLFDVETGRMDPVDAGDVGKRPSGVFAASSSGRYFVLPSTRDTLVVVDRDDCGTARELQFSSQQQSHCDCLGFSPDEKYLVAACAPTHFAPTPRELPTLSAVQEGLLLKWRDKFLTMWKVQPASEGDDWPRTTSSSEND